MPVITLKTLVAKNKAGNGIRNKENNAAALKLSQILKNAAKHLDNDALALGCSIYSDALDKLAKNPVTQSTRPVLGNALKNLDGMDDALNYRTRNVGKNGYEELVEVLPKIGASKEEFDRLLRSVNDVFELGMDKTILKPVDPREQERLRQEQERLRREQERQRLEQERQRQEQERQRQEQARLERERQERERLERERVERERQERERLERERLRQQELARQREEQRKQQRVNELKTQRTDFLREAPLDAKDYEKPEVAPTKIEADYKVKLDAVNAAEEVEDNPRILEGEKERVLQERDRLLNDPIARRRQEKEDAALLAEDAAKNDEPIRQTKTAMVSQEMKDSFLKRFPDSEKLVARDSFGVEIQGTDAILHALAEERSKIYIDVPDDPDFRCTCLSCENGHLYISNGPVGFQSNPDLHRADPDPTLESDFEKLYAENGIESAVDKDGNVLTKKEEMLDALSKHGDRVLVFGKDKAFAIALENNDEVLHATRKMEQREPNFNTVSRDRIPEKTMLLGINEKDILYAQTEDGRRLDTPEAIRSELRDQGSAGRMYLFTNKDPESAYLVRHVHGEAVGISPHLTHKSQLESLSDDDVEPMDMSAVEEKRILNWKESDISHAVDDKGRRYETPEAIKTALYGADKTLQIYTKDDEQPFAVQKKNNRFYISPERVTKFEDQMKELGEQLGELDGDAFRRVNVPMSTKDRLESMDVFRKKTGFAVDEDGRQYHSLDELVTELEKPDDKTVYVFDKKGEPPFAIQKKDGMFYKSDDRISTRSIMPESAGFQPKKSLRVDDIVHVSRKGKVFELKEQADDLKRAIKFSEKNIKALKKASEKPAELKRPVRPRLGFFNTIAYRVKRFFGGGETDAYVAYTARKKRYAEDLALYPMRKKQHEQATKDHNDYLNGGAEKLASFEQKLAQSKQQLSELTAAQTVAEQEHGEAMRGNDENAVNKYRRKIETRLEGVADLQQRGIITPHNIFAYSWLKEAECKGKPANDPAAREAFCAWMAASGLENELLKNRVNAKVLSDAAEESKLLQLNNGTIVNAMMKDPDLQKLFDDMGDKPIDPDELKTAYEEKVAQRTLEKKDDIKYLEDAKEHMNRRFGTQTISETNEKDFEKTFEMVLRYKTLVQDIRTQKNQIPAIDPAGIEGRFAEAKKLEANAYRNKITELHKFPYRKAFESMKGMTMTLDEMSTELDKRKLQLERQVDGPQA